MYSVRGKEVGIFVCRLIEINNGKPVFPCKLAYNPIPYAHTCVPFGICDVCCQNEDERCAVKLAEKEADHLFICPSIFTCSFCFRFRM